jgi:glycogen operon protein
MLATLLFSQGTPMLLAGDELGNTQHGNNNAYAQDNETSWLDWSNADREFMEQVRELVWLRRETPLLHVDEYLHGTLRRESSTIRNCWLNKYGEIKRSEQWAVSDAFSALIEEINGAKGITAVAILINRYHKKTILKLPPSSLATDWRVVFSSGREPEAKILGLDVTVPGESVVLLTSG